MTIKEELKLLHDKTMSMGYEKEAVIIANAAMEIEHLQDELLKTQTELKARDESKVSNSR